MHEKVGPWCKDYSTGVMSRLVFMLFLWVWYGLAPYYIPLNTLWIVTVIFVAASIDRFRRDKRLLAAFHLIAATLNSFLISYVNPELNLYICLIITAIILYDVVEAPQKAVEGEH